MDENACENFKVSKVAKVAFSYLTMTSLLMKRAKLLEAD